MMAVCALVAPAAHAADGGGATVVATPKMDANSMVVRKITCLNGCSSITYAQPGATLRFQGPRLTKGKRVVYLGAAGPADDVLAKLTVKKSGSSKVITAVVPKRAASGPVAIEVAAGARSPASALSVTLPPPPQIIAAIEGNGPFFPIRGKYKFGTGAAAFGGGRGHEGQDVFADCGTPLVAAEGGKVVMQSFQARAGNYIVIQVDGADRAEAYMHLAQPAMFKEGDTVAAGAQVGNVGDTGRADGCHLHFELWIGHWQGVGGAGNVIDPLPTLKSWSKLGVPASVK
ncbi:MAG: M23 family metallopeptidase [Solirubrobacteraceae bacterium]|nr:M23 family metallopeptidase [Solirubrobacteraceae bacterium]